MTIPHQLWAFIRRDCLLASSAPLTLVWQLITVVFAAPTMYYLGRLVQPSAPDLQPYGGSYFAFVILGIAFSGFFAALMSGCAAGIRREQLSGTLDAVLVSPASLATVVIGGAFWSTAVAAVQASIYLIVGTVLFHVGFGTRDIAAAAVTVVVSIAVFAVLGMAAAAFVLASRTGDPLTGVLAGASALLAGVFYPTTVLSPALQRIAQWVPLTHALQAIRLSLLAGAGVVALREELVALTLFLVVLLPVAVAMLYAAAGAARRRGTLLTP